MADDPAVPIRRRSDLLTREEAAVYLGCSRSWLAQKSDMGQRPTVTRIARKVYYTLADLDKFIEQQRGAAQWQDGEHRSKSVTGSARSRAVRVKESRPMVGRGISGYKRKGYNSTGRHSESTDDTFLKLKLAAGRK